MADEKKEPEVLDGEVVEEGSEEEQEGQFRVYALQHPQQQFLIADDEMFPKNLIFINEALGVGFAVPYEYAHTFAHMIHEALEMNGFSPEEGAEESKEKKILLN